MKRTVFDLLLVIALGAAAAFGWLRYQAGVGAAAQVAELTPQTAGAVTKLAETEKALEQVQAELSPLREQAQQLSVYKSVFANGDILRDLDAAYRKEKAPLSPERQLGLGTLRLLTKGGADPTAVDAFTRALDTAHPQGHAAAKDLLDRIAPPETKQTVSGDADAPLAFTIVTGVPRAED